MTAAPIDVPSAGPSPIAPDEAGISSAARALREGRLVVFPTETVYGLGASGLDAAALDRLFLAKGRPLDNPLILHVASPESARDLYRTFPDEAVRLASAFWPGPLTLVLSRDPKVPDAVTCGLDTVAVRVPSHPIARALLVAAGVPIAAPSANLSGRPSPTRVEDARADLGDRVAVYLDGGPSPLGVESTVIGLAGDAAVLLRPGGLAREAIEEVLGRKLLLPAPEEPARSPGMKYRHYAPRARVHVAPEGEILSRVAALEGAGRRVAIVASAESIARGILGRCPGAREDGEAWARMLYSLLRDLDAEGVDDIVVEEVPERGVGAAVMNRLRKAAQGG